MKKLFLCTVLAVGLIVVVAARARSGSAALTAAESSVLAVETLMAMASERGMPAQIGWFAGGMAPLLEPGAYLSTRLGVLPTTPTRVALTAFVSWWIWVAGARLIWSTAGRASGTASMAHWYIWLFLTPPWRPVYRVWLGIDRWIKLFFYGKRATAAWAGVLATMTLIFRPGDCVFLGRLWAFGVGLYQAIGIRGPRHITVVAAAGAGKTRWLMAWLGMLHKKGSAFVVDCDGQMVNALGKGLERAGHGVLNLDPFYLTDFPGACWNTLDEITAAVKRHGRAAAVRFSQVLAEALIQDDNKHQPVFSATARVFIHGLILYVWLFEPPERRNLVRVRELLTQGMPELALDPEQDPFDLLLRRMLEAAGYDDECERKICEVIVRAAAVMKSGKGREGNPFRTTAISQTAWLDVPEIQAISTRSDFVGEDLKLDNPCVFICAPVTDIQTKLSGWVRLLTMSTMYAFQNIPGRLKIPCAFCIDEMPSLRLEILETAAPVFRKFGIRLVIITQDLERLRQAHPQSYGGFIGNSQATLWMGTDHQESLEFLSKVLGSATLSQKVDGGMFSKIAARIERREQPLMTPDQLREFLDPDRGQIIVTRTGKSPLRLAYEGYDRALPVWKYEQDKNFREPLLRACTRRLLRWLRPSGPPTAVGTAQRRAGIFQGEQTA